MFWPLAPVREPPPVDPAGKNRLARRSHAGEAMRPTQPRGRGVRSRADVPCQPATQPAAHGRDPPPDNSSRFAQPASKYRCAMRFGSAGSGPSDFAADRATPCTRKKIDVLASSSKFSLSRLSAWRSPRPDSSFSEKSGEKGLPQGPWGRILGNKLYLLGFYGILNQLLKA